MFVGLQNVAEDAVARRAWLWFRARERGDGESLACLTRADPGLRERMARCDALARSLEDPRARRLAYSVMMDRLLVEASGIRCGCRECAAWPGGMIAAAMGVDRLGLVGQRGER